MKVKEVDNLVICSTLNQITNYLIIKRFKPKRIWNLTFKKDDIEKFNINIKNNIWDKNLILLCKELGYKETKDYTKIEGFTNVEFEGKEFNNLKCIKKKINSDVIKKIGKENVYWHITGGQRTFALAINELINEKGRKEDRIVYIEGNTEKLIITNITDKDSISDEDNKYCCNDLSLLEVLNLVGFQYKSEQLEHTKIFKEQGKPMINNKNKEYKFYKKLYSIMCLDTEKKEIKFEYEDKEYKDTFRNLLLQSNDISKDNGKRKEFIKKVFEGLLNEYEELKKIGYYNDDLIEIDQSYPAGYVFEKIVAYKIYELVKNNSKIVGMEHSLKIYFNDNRDVKYMIDELDIVLLTDTGKIINFECKSGGMKSDNAKSHNYTTYRLAGVFGMPILASPLYDNETLEDYKNTFLDKQIKAFRAAKVAEMIVFPIDKIKEGLEKLLV